MCFQPTRWRRNPDNTQMGTEPMTSSPCRFARDEAGKAECWSGAAGTSEMPGTSGVSSSVKPGNPWCGIAVESKHSREPSENSHRLLYNSAKASLSRFVCVQSGSASSGWGLRMVRIGASSSTTRREAGRSRLAWRADPNPLRTCPRLRTRVPGTGRALRGVSKNPTKGLWGP